MNYLHKSFRKSGKISDSDMLYTLSLFALEPSRWVEKYEWRCLTELELCACGTFWKSLGDAMMIPYLELPSCATGWQDGLHWLNEVREWSLGYEEAHMVPAKTNRDLANAHLNVLFTNMPNWVIAIGKKSVTVLLGEGLRKAFMCVFQRIQCSRWPNKILNNASRFPESPVLYHKLIFWALHFRKVLIRCFFLPRPEFMRKNFIPSGPDSSTGRFNSIEYLSYPWYVKPSLSRRWGPKSWMTRLLGRKLPGDDGNRYAPEGYMFAEIGPEAQSGKGIKEMDETCATLTRTKRGGCPF